ncbi:MAG: 3-oxoacyl-[acyl-carrier-protein] reductase [Verrucomicrobiota bacterium]
MPEFENLVSVVTGGGRGIGLAISKRLAEAGAKVAVVSRTESNAQKAAEEINAIQPGAAKAYAVDVADVDATAETGKAIVADFGQVDILVNNAGVTRDGLLLRMSDEDWDTVLDTNLKGAFNMVKAVQRPILKSKHGRIINISSVIGLVGNPGQANYAASKAGLIGFTKSLAREFAKRKITANTIAPGFIVTDMTDELTDEQKASILPNIPLGTLGEVEDIAEAAAFLASARARYITGQTLTVDGGMVMS